MLNAAQLEAIMGKLLGLAAKSRNVPELQSVLRKLHVGGTPLGKALTPVEKEVLRDEVARRYGQSLKVDPTKVGDPQIERLQGLRGKVERAQERRNQGWKSKPLGDQLEQMPVEYQRDLPLDEINQLRARGVQGVAESEAALDYLERLGEAHPNRAAEAVEKMAQAEKRHDAAMAMASLKPGAARALPSPRPVQDLERFMAKDVSADTARYLTRSGQTIGSNTDMPAIQAMMAEKGIDPSLADEVAAKVRGTVKRDFVESKEHLAAVRGIDPVFENEIPNRAPRRGVAEVPRNDYELARNLEAKGVNSLMERIRFVNKGRDIRGPQLELEQAPLGWLAGPGVGKDFLPEDPVASQMVRELKRLGGYMDKKFGDGAGRINPAVDKPVATALGMEFIDQASKALPAKYVDLRADTMPGLRDLLGNRAQWTRRNLLKGKGVGLKAGLREQEGLPLTPEISAKRSQAARAVQAMRAFKRGDYTEGVLWLRGANVTDAGRGGAEAARSMRAAYDEGVRNVKSTGYRKPTRWGADGDTGDGYSAAEDIFEKDMRLDEQGVRKYRTDLEKEYEWRKRNEGRRDTAPLPTSDEVGRTRDVDLDALAVLEGNRRKAMATKGGSVAAKVPEPQQLMMFDPKDYPAELGQLFKLGAPPLWKPPPMGHNLLEQLMFEFPPAPGSGIDLGQSQKLALPTSKGGTDAARNVLKETKDPAAPSQAAVAFGKKVARLRQQMKNPGYVEDPLEALLRLNPSLRRAVRRVPEKIDLAASSWPKAKRLVGPIPYQMTFADLRRLMALGAGAA